MRFAYADPPYLGCGSLYAAHHPNALDWDNIETHRELVARLCDEYADGWCMSLSSTSLREILPLCPDDCRIMSWMKPFASFKPNVGLAYTWEPVVMRGGRKITREQNTVRDHLCCPITLKKGLTGAKPPEFCRWLLAALNFQNGDTLDDLFPGTGIMGQVVTEHAEMLI